MQPKAHVLALMSLLDVLLLLELVAGLTLVRYAWLWIALHVAFVVFGTVMLSMVLTNMKARNEQASDTFTSGVSSFSSKSELIDQYPLFSLLALLGVMVPGVGLAGVSLAMVYGLHGSLTRTYVPEYWQITPAAKLPYVAPNGRALQALDSRGFSEHLLYSNDEEDLYRKILSSANVRTSLAINTLKQAMGHRDERVRLTAYKTLDKKVTALNKQIQALEKSVVNSKDEEHSDQWLQIASNYWELVTLEGGEAVARKQLLAKAASAAIKSVGQEADNRNAHLVLGRIWLAQGEVRRATVALERSHALGMPSDKVIPYLAECAYMSRDLPRVRTLLSKLDSSIVDYPPLSHVARYWA